MTGNERETESSELPDPLEAAIATAAAHLRTIARVAHEQTQAASEQMRAQSEQQAVRRWAERLNQAVRRMRQASDSDMWGQAFAETAGAPYVAVFRLVGEDLRLVGLHGAASAESQKSLRERGLPKKQAPALANALEAQDTVVALRTVGEVSSELMDLFPDAAAGKVYLFPLSAKRKASGLLYLIAGEQPPDLNSLEMLAALAEASWQDRPVPESPAAKPLVNIGTVAPPTAKQEWRSLSRTEQDLHLRAQNFARSQVARLLLRQHDVVRTGREMGNLYLSFQRAIDEDRRTYRERFMYAQPSMVDYLHLELVRTLAEGNGALLGSEYPGPLA